MSLKGFEDYTYKPTPEELKRHVPVMMGILESHIGKANVINNATIVTMLASAAIKTKPERVRKLINYIRNNDLIPGLIANSKGYYISMDVHEIMEYVDSLSGRESAIAHIKYKLLQYALILNRAEIDSIPHAQALSRTYALECYDFIKGRTPEDSMPTYTPVLIGNLAYSLSIPNFLHLIIGHNRDYIEGMSAFFKERGDLTRYNLLNEQIQRISIEMPDCLFSGINDHRAAA